MPPLILIALSSLDSCIQQRRCCPWKGAEMLGIVLTAPPTFVDMHLADALVHLFSWCPFHWLMLSVWCRQLAQCHWCILHYVTLSRRWSEGLYSGRGRGKHFSSVHAARVSTADCCSSEGSSCGTFVVWCWTHSLCSWCALWSETARWTRTLVKACWLWQEQQSMSAVF